jgi:FMN phosphatase YigB (HAD superfamily)
MDQAITFDFHDTLVRCDEWFELEVRTLPGEFLFWYSGENGGRSHNDSAEVVNAKYRRLRAAIAAHGHELTAETLLAIVLAAVEIQIDEETIVRGVHNIMKSAVKSASPVPGAIELVRHLSQLGIRMGVVSSAVYHSFIEWALDKFEIGGLFDVIVTSASSRYYKSRPEIYWYALSQLSALPASSLHVGDSARFDVDGAHRAGMRAVWLNHGSHSRAETLPELKLESLIASAPKLVGVFADKLR